MSRDARFMEDAFDSGKYATTIDSNSSEYITTDKANRDEDYNVHYNEIDRDNMDDQAPEPFLIHERPQ